MTNEWISVKDRLPPEGEYIILYANKPASEEYKSGPQIFVGYRGNYDPEEYDSAWGDGWIPFDFEDITHWMPLPAPPKEDE